MSNGDYEKVTPSNETAEKFFKEEIKPILIVFI